MSSKSVASPAPLLVRLVSILLPVLVCGTAAWWFLRVPVSQVPMLLPDDWTPGCPQAEATWQTLPPWGPDERRLQWQLDLAGDPLLTYEEMHDEPVFITRRLSDGQAQGTMPLADTDRSASADPATLVLWHELPTKDLAVQLLSIADLTVRREFVLHTAEALQTDTSSYLQQTYWTLPGGPDQATYYLVSLVEQPAGALTGLLGLSSPSAGIYDLRNDWGPNFDLYWFTADADGHLTQTRPLYCLNCGGRPFPAESPTSLLLSRSFAPYSAAIRAIDLATGESIAIPEGADRDANYGILFRHADEPPDYNRPERHWYDKPRASLPPPGYAPYVHAVADVAPPCLELELSRPAPFEAIAPAPDTPWQSALGPAIAAFRARCWQTLYGEREMQLKGFEALHLDGITLVTLVEGKMQARAITGDLVATARCELSDRIAGLRGLQELPPDPLRPMGLDFGDGIAATPILDLNVLPLPEGRFLVLQVVQALPDSLRATSEGLLRLGFLEQGATEVKWAVWLPLQGLPDAELRDRITDRLALCREGDTLLLQLDSGDWWDDSGKDLYWCRLECPEALRSLPEGVIP